MLFDLFGEKEGVEWDYRDIDEIEYSCDRQILRLFRNGSYLGNIENVKNFTFQKVHKSGTRIEQYIPAHVFGASSGELEIQFESPVAIKRDQKKIIISDVT